MMERRRGFMWSAALHTGLWALVFAPWSLWVGGRGSSSTITELSHYVPIPLVSGDPPPQKTTCREKPCLGEGPRPAAHPEPSAPQGEELEFLDDTEHALMPALRRADGWIAIVLRADRWRSLAFYRVADGKDLGVGIDLARFPLRVIVHEPESYPEIARWLASVGNAAESLRTVAVFPPQTQRRLHDKIEAEANRTGLPRGPRRAVVAISSTEPIGIAVRSVALRSEVPPKSAVVLRQEGSSRRTTIEGADAVQIFPARPNYPWIGTHLVLQQHLGPSQQRSSLAVTPSKAFQHPEIVQGTGLSSARLPDLVCQGLSRQPWRGRNQA